MWRIGCWAAAVVAMAGIVSCAAPGAGAPTPWTDPSESVDVSVSSSPEPSGDSAPHQAENNGWKQRRDLSEAERGAGEKLAARIRTALTPLRANADFAPESTREALVGLGLAEDAVQVEGLRPALGMGPAPPGAAYVVRFGDLGCVIGSIRPDRLTTEVTGAAAEFGCLEPSAH